jgi:hypothetical protein
MTAVEKNKVQQRDTTYITILGGARNEMPHDRARHNLELALRVCALHEVDVRHLDLLDSRRDDGLLAIYNSILIS